MRLALIRKLFDHMTWADAAVERSLASADAPDPEALAVFAHVLGAELVWLDRVEGRERSVAVWPEVASAADCASLAARSRERFGAYIGALTETELDRGVVYANSAGQEFTTAVADILLQLATHGSYHRGQVARMLRLGGETPPGTDYISWVRGVPAARTERG
jgi:uncharacterized damage-inducible protein DinB